MLGLDSLEEGFEMGAVMVHSYFGGWLCFWIPLGRFVCSFHLWFCEDCVQFTSSAVWMCRRMCWRPMWASAWVAMTASIRFDVVELGLHLRNLQQVGRMFMLLLLLNGIQKVLIIHILLWCLQFCSNIDDRFLLFRLSNQKALKLFHGWIGRLIDHQSPWHLRHIRGAALLVQSDFQAWNIQDFSFQ